MTDVPHIKNTFLMKIIQVQKKSLKCMYFKRTKNKFTLINVESRFHLEIKSF